ncbi:MAG: hypothetical protein DRP64_15450 [Verrucomicrobia bacterium]|nr:MAG: hypothetical protein DRP64_15450 [Verrucomicrobiota bacterium]
MIEKTSDNVELVDQFAEKIHGFVDRLQERASGMEKVAGEDSAAMFSERAMAKVESKLDKFQSFVDKDPMKASLMAFGIGALSTRVMKKRAAKAELVEEASSEKPKKAKVSKAA